MIEELSIKTCTKRTGRDQTDANRTGEHEYRHNESKTDGFEFVTSSIKWIGGWTTTEVSYDEQRTRQRLFRIIGLRTNTKNKK